MKSKEEGRIYDGYDRQELLQLPLMERMRHFLSLVEMDRDAVLSFEQESATSSLREEADAPTRLLHDYDLSRAEYIAELEELFSREMSTEEVYAELRKQYDVYLERVNIPLDDIEALPRGEQRATAYMRWWADSWRCSLIIRLTKIVEEPIDLE